MEDFKTGMVMRKIALTTALTLYSIQAFAEVKMYGDAWGKNCYPKDQSYSVKLINKTSEPIDFKLCLQRTTGTWSCFRSSNVAPGEVEPNSWGYYVCKGTGKSKWWWREAGTNASFPNP